MTQAGISIESQSLKKIESLYIWTNKIDPNYKKTALDAARRMPADGSRSDRSKFVCDYMRDKHPEITWSVKLDIGFYAKTLKMVEYGLYSQYLSFDLNGNGFRVFESKEKREEKSFKT